MMAMVKDCQMNINLKLKAMKKLFLLALICLNGVAFSQQCCSNFNNFQSNNYFYNTNPYIQTTQIYSYPTPTPQYRTEFGQIFDGIIKAVAVNRILKNEREYYDNVRCNNKPRKRRKRRFCR
jgi:hypothetical protein